MSINRVMTVTACVYAMKNEMYTLLSSRPILGTQKNTSVKHLYTFFLLKPYTHNELSLSATTSHWHSLHDTVQDFEF
jgi:hypothetical protein